MTVADSGERWLSISAASRAVGMSRTTLLAAEEAGLITPSRTPGGHRRYGLMDLRRYIERAEGETPSSEPGSMRPLSPGKPAVEAACLAAVVRAAVRPLVQALNGDSAGLYLLQDDALRFCAAFGIPRWLTDRLTDTVPPPVVAQALESRRHRHFDPTATAFPEPRATGHGLTVAVRRDDRTLGVLFLLTPIDRELRTGELRVVDAFTELITTVVDDQRRIAELEGRLTQIAALSTR